MGLCQRSYDHSVHLTMVIRPWRLETKVGSKVMTSFAAPLFGNRRLEALGEQNMSLTHLGKFVQRSESTAEIWSKLSHVLHLPLRVWLSVLVPLQAALVAQCLATY